MAGQITSKDFKNIISQNKICVLDYYATWCMPCTMMSKVVDNVEYKYPQILFVKINIDEEPTIAISQHIEAVPTFVAYKNGAEINRLIGYTEQKDFETFLKMLK